MVTEEGVAADIEKFTGYGMSGYPLLNKKLRSLRKWSGRKKHGLFG